jgi:hypothetical protein
MKRKLKIPTSLTFGMAAVVGLLFASDLMAAKGPQPSICTRSCWGARGARSVSYMSALSRGIIHHTAGAGDYNTSSLTTSKSKVRGIQNLHMDANGWSDIAYHFLTDKLGNLFEGRYGSMSNLPRGAHDGCNANSFGFNVMGYYHTPYNQAFTSASEESLEKVIAWRMPSSWSANGSGSYCSRTVYTLDGHHKVKATACPGTIIINRLSAVRSGVMAKKNGATPSAPSNLKATAISSSRIDLSWTDNSSIESGFKVERKTGSGGTYNQITTRGANVRTYSNTGLASGTTYYYRVRAYNATGNSPYSNSSGATTKDTIPAAPSALTATAVSDKQINLAWTDNSPNEDGFRVFRSTDGTNFTQIASVGINVKTYASAGLTGNRRYYYRVRSYNTAGLSGNSNTANDITAPQAPTALTAASAGSGPTTWDKVNLAWTDNASSEAGFKIERATASAGPFTQIATNAASDTTYTATGLAAQTTYYFRVRTYNSNGNSAYSNTASTATPNAPPTLTAIGNKTVAVSSALTFTAAASDPNKSVVTTTWQTFQSYSGTASKNDTITFRKPSNSASTSAFQDTSTNYTLIRTNGPTGNGSTHTLKAGWGFKTGTANYWVRLNTFNTLTNPNPTIALDQIVRFKIHSSKAVKIGLGVRETGTTAAYGANGGTTGAIEWVGVTNVVSGNPVPNKLVAANAWTTLSFNIPFEPKTAYTGDGIIPQTGKGVLEHVIIRGEGGTGAYAVYFDDMAVVAQNTLAYTLDAGAPAGASIERRTGKFTWTPTTGQAGTHTFNVRVTDQGGAQDFETITVTVTGTGNNPPVLAAIGNKTVKEELALTFTATATDADASQTKTFTLDAGAPAGASISTAGAFTWTPTEAQGPGSYPITVRVTDNGSPVASDTETITVTVSEANKAPVLAAISNGTANEGTAFNASASATDPDAPANGITYSLENAPPGMTISATTGAITWTPGEDDGPDDHQVTVRATDNGSPSLYAVTSFTVTVNEVNVAPVLTVPTSTTKLYDFAAFDATDDEPNGVVMFRQPSFSSTSSSFLDATPNETVLVSYPEFPDADGNGSLKVLKTSFSIKTGITNPWLRLTTFTMQTNPAWVPNPTLDLGQKLRFRVYSDKSIKLAIAVRETGVNAPIGYNGGVSGSVEYLGVTGKQSNGCPIPNRTIAAGVWTEVEFNLPTEPCTNFVSGNSILATGRGVLEQLAIVPNGGTGAYNVYLDDFQVVKSSADFTVDTYATLSFSATATDADRPLETTLTYSLDVNAPTNALIEEGTGLFTWTPLPEQSPSTNTFNIIVTDDGVPPLSHSRPVTVIVNKVNTVPTLGNLPDETVEIVNSQVFYLDVDGNDDDMPGDTLTYSLPVKPTGATINATTGEISWTAPASGTSVNTFTVRVTDNGSPVLFSEETFLVSVVAPNAAPVLTLGAARVTEPVVTFETFANGTPNEQVMFKKPANSTTTSAYIDTAATNYTTVTSTFPAGNANAGSRVLRAEWTFKTGVTDYWVRLVTFDTTSLPNPTINASARLKFDIYPTKALKVGVGIRETGTTAENGANGGTTGAIEYVGCGGKIGSTPIPARSVAAGTWTTLEFDFPTELVQTLTGDGILSGGQQVLEHLILKAEGGVGLYTVYVDNFQVVNVIPSLDSDPENGEVTVQMKANSTLSFDASAVDAHTVTFGLEAGPAGATINSSTGVFSWTPSSLDTNVFDFGVFVQDSPGAGVPSKRDSDQFNVEVIADAVAVQAADDGQSVGAGETVTLSWGAVAGQAYVIQAKEAGGSWTDISTVTAESADGSATVTNDGADRFYRVVEAGDSAAE